MEANNSNGNSSSPIKITVKFGGKSIPVSVSSESTVKDLKSLLQPLTDVLPRGQRLISKGRLLADDHLTLAQSGLAHGAKLMLLASHGLHQGSGPVLKDAKTRPIERTSQPPRQQPGLLGDRSRLKLVKVTGVVALSQSNLKAVPDEVWDCGPSVRVLDIRDNLIDNLPARIGSLSSLQKLYLDGNGLTNESVHWEGLTSLKHLTILSASQNRFTSLPSGLGALHSLRQLNVSNNLLTSFPIDIGLLARLEVLNASNNRIESIPACIGDCTSLVEVDLSANILTELPETVGQLSNLKLLHLSNNGLKSVPRTLFKMCQNLATLNLHNTEITMDMLRQCEGWEEFDRRRMLKHQKQLDFRVADAERFDEGADKS